MRDAITDCRDPARHCDDAARSTAIGCVWGASARALGEFASILRRAP